MWFSVKLGRFRLSPWGGSVGLGRVRVGSRWPWARRRGGRASLLGEVVEVAEARRAQRLEAEARRHQHALNALNDTERPVTDRVQVAKDYLGRNEVAAAEAIPEDQLNTIVGREALDFKRRDSAAYQQMLRSLPAEDRKQIIDAVAAVEGTAAGGSE